MSEAGAGDSARGTGSALRQTLIYGGGLVFNRLVAFVMLPVYTRYIPPADYGVLQLLGVTMDIVALVAGARLAGGIFYFYHGAESDRDRHRVLGTSLLTLGGTYALLGVAVALLADPISRLVFHDASRAMLVRLAGVSFVFEAPMLVGLTTLQVWHRPLGYVGATAGKLAIQVALNLVVLIGLGWGVTGVMGVTALANALVGTTLAAVVLRTTGLAYDATFVRRLVRYGLPLVGTQVATMLPAYGDRYVLNAVQGPAAVGVYSVGYQFGVLVLSLAFAPIAQMWEPRRFAVAREPERDRIYAQAWVLVNVIVISFAVAVVLAVGDYLRVATPAAYHGAAGIVPLVTAAFVFQAWTDFHNVGLMMRERTEWLTVATWLGAVVAVAGFLTLIPVAGAVGAALALAVAYLVRFVLVYRASQRLWPVAYRWAPVLRLCAIATAACGAVMVLPELPVPLSLGVRLLVATAYALLMLGTGVLGPDERAVIRRAIGDARARLRLTRGASCR